MGDYKYETTTSEETLRDRFAMAALTGMLTRSYGDEDFDWSSPYIAKQAYEYADAMLEARDKVKADG